MRPNHSYSQLPGLPIWNKKDLKRRGSCTTVFKRRIPSYKVQDDNTAFLDKRYYPTLYKQRTRQLSCNMQTEQASFNSVFINSTVPMRTVRILLVWQICKHPPNTLRHYICPWRSHGHCRYLGGATRGHHRPQPVSRATHKQRICILQRCLPMHMPCK